MGHEVILKFWFCRGVEEVIFLSENRIIALFKVSEELGLEIAVKFSKDLKIPIGGQYLVIYTLSIYVNGIEKKEDRKLSLIQRVYYFPFCCTRKIYTITKFSLVLYNVIRSFGRFL